MKRLTLTAIAILTVPVSATAQRPALRDAVDPVPREAPTEQPPGTVYLRNIRDISYPWVSTEDTIYEHDGERWRAILLPSEARGVLRVAPPAFMDLDGRVFAWVRGCPSGNGCWFVDPRARRGPVEHVVDLAYSSASETVVVGWEQEGLRLWQPTVDSRNVRHAGLIQAMAIEAGELWFLDQTRIFRMSLGQQSAEVRDAGFANPVSGRGRATALAVRSGPLETALVVGTAEGSAYAYRAMGASGWFRFRVLSGTGPVWDMGLERRELVWISGRGGAAQWTGSEWRVVRSRETAAHWDAAVNLYAGEDGLFQNEARVHVRASAPVRSTLLERGSTATGGR